jgi:hypothetical protein
MNERIRELIQMADLCAAGLMASGASEEEIHNRSKVVLAELIVRECISVVDDAERGGSNEVWDNAVKFIRRDLQEHFGVKE